MKLSVKLFISLLMGALLNGCNNPTPVIAHHGMVVTEQRLASQVGLEILRHGGNAIDAAVATGYALAVVNPCCGNIGGGGFMLIHLADGRNVVLNFREKAPLRASENMYLDIHKRIVPHASLTGFRAVAVPGTVLGFETALQKYGTMSRQQVMAPAVHLAHAGYAVTSSDARWFKKYADDFRDQSNVAAIFLKNNQPYQTGEVLIQKDLGNTLQQIMDKGPSVFYKGPIAQKIVTAAQAQGGILTLRDFADYRVQELAPISCNYRGYTLYSAPPPSAGGIMLCEALNILENFPLKLWGPNSPYSIRTTIEAMRYAFMDRNQLGDPDFFNNPVQALIAKQHALPYSQKISQSLGAPLTKPLMLQSESSDTTHYSILDSKGNAVAVTYTLNGFFGARVIAEDTGFFLNNEMDDFSVKKGSTNKFNLMQSAKNSIAPGRRPLSSMAPTIVTKNGRVFMILGSPGGPRIVTAILLTLLNVIDYGMNIQAAVNASRFHYQVIPDIIVIEPFGISFLTRVVLMGWNYQVVPHKHWAAVEAIEINPPKGLIYGASDYRREAGAAMGY
jgi:gamma-glutamyltranspeptidase/glutathione hydrolase